MAVDLASEGYVEKVTHDLNKLIAQESFLALAPL
jgi:hypothetical protein